MSTQDIIDYVMETPYNTNPAILRQKLNKLAGGASKTLIITAPDANSYYDPDQYQTNMSLEEFVNSFLNGSLAGIWFNGTQASQAFPMHLTHIEYSDDQNRADEVYLYPVSGSTGFSNLRWSFSYGISPEFQGGGA